MVDHNPITIRNLTRKVERTLPDLQWLRTSATLPAKEGAIMALRITFTPTGEDFVFEFRSHKQAGDALALLREHGFTLFLARYGEYAV